jgi:hypothetical protein
MIVIGHMHEIEILVALVRSGRARDISTYHYHASSTRNDKWMIGTCNSRCCMHACICAQVVHVFVRWSEKSLLKVLLVGLS